MPSYIASPQAYVVLPGGETFGDWARPQMEKVLETGGPMPFLLPHFTGEEQRDGNG